MTFFGSLGPKANLGDVIEVEPLDAENSFRFLRIVKPAQVWTRQIQGVQRDKLEREEVRERLDEIVAAGGMWELNPAGLIAQMIRRPSDAGMPEQLKNLDRVIAPRRQGRLIE